MRNFVGEMAKDKTAAFADPNIYCFLESEDYFYAIRLKGNDILYKQIGHLLTHPVGRSPGKPIV